MLTRLLLAADELRDLTGRLRPGAQGRALRAMGIEHKARPDGTLAVLRAHVEAALGATANARICAPLEPNWAAVT